MKPNVNPIHPTAPLHRLARAGRRVLFAAAGLLAAGCGGGGTPTPGGGTPPGVPVLSVAPAQVELGAAATQQFTATLDGVATTAVVWTLASGPGTLTPEGLYTAPPAVAAPGLSAVVRAEAQADARSKANASVTLRAVTASGLEGLATAIAFAEPDRLSWVRRRQSGDAVTWAWEAGQLSGRGGFVPFGTIRASGGAQLVWEQTPGDRLVVVLMNGTREFTYHAMNGDGSNVAAFLNNDHDIDVRVVVALDYDLRLVTQRRGTQYSNRITGSTLRDGNTVEVDVSIAERVVHDSSGGWGFEYETVETMTGSLRATGVDVRVQDDGEFKTARNDTPPPHLRTTAVMRRRTSASSFVIGGTTFELRDAVLHQMFSNERPTEADNWLATGTLLREGDAFGRIERVFDGSHFTAHVQLGTTAHELLRVAFP